MSLHRLIVAARPHFWTSLVLFLLIASMIVNESRDGRFYTFLPVMALYILTLSFYSLEHDALRKTVESGEAKELAGAVERPVVSKPLPPRHHREALEFFKNRSILYSNRGW